MSGQDKGFTPTEPVVAASITGGGRSLNVGGSGECCTELAGLGAHSSLNVSQKYSPEEKEALHQNRIYTTKPSALTGTESSADEADKQKSWYKLLNPFKRGPAPPIPETRQLCREYNASFLSLVCFQWITPLMSVGYKRPLEQNDIWTLNPERKAEVMTNHLQASFKRRLARGEKYPLLFALHDTFKAEFWIGGICSLFLNILIAILPFTLRYLIQFATDAYVAAREGEPAPKLGRGVGLVLGITFMQICQSLSTNHFLYFGMMVGGQSRAVLVSLIFEKAMRISGRAKAGGRADADSLDGERQAEEIGKASGKKSEKRGTKGTVDAGKGISGDGTGWQNGRVVNLMSVDAHRIDLACGWFHLIWTAPLACLTTLVLLIANLTYSGVAGFAVLLVGLPLLTKATKALFARRRKINGMTDERVNLTQEVLQSVRLIKLFSWESAFLDRLGEIRNREICSIQILLAIGNAINAVSISMPIFSGMIAFICYSLTNHDLTPARVFSSLAIFNSMRMPLNLLPVVYGQTIDAWGSINRIQEYLTSEEQEDMAKFNANAKDAIEMDQADFTWERIATQDSNSLKAANKNGKQTTNDVEKTEKRIWKQAVKDAKTASELSGSGHITPDDETSLVEEKEPFKLRDMNFSIGRDELVAVIGGVGSGKSALLAALAGDMRKTKGNLTIGASRAFCAQSPWIQNTSVQNNILFGKKMDKDWYRKVIRACALEADLDMLPNGDETEIGERGITLSGGQKQRLNIARAIYFDANLIIMDDPLSAVDVHVGRHIFDKAIMGLLKSKARILATHQLWVLNRCNRIIWLEDGKIQAIDTFDNLMKDYSRFRVLIESTAFEEDQDQHVDDDEVEEEKKTMKKNNEASTLMQAEERAVKGVSWSVYVDFVRASGSLFYAPLVLGLLILSQGANILTSLWLSWWTSSKWGYSKGVYIGVYGALGALQALLFFAFAVSLTILGTTASKRMLNQAITRILRSPMSFFDTTPLGRITNRFTHDVDIMDNHLTDAIRLCFLPLATTLSVFILIIAYFYYFAIALGPLLLVFLFASGYYSASAREIKRFESVLRSNVSAKFNEGLSGTASIRAYGQIERFINDFRTSINEMNSAYFLTFANQRWLSIRLSLIGNILVFVTGMLVVTSRFDVSPSIGGLVLSYILSIVQAMQFLVSQLADVESGIIATERLHYYGTSLEEEAPLRSPEGAIPKSWPESGEIIFEDIRMRYRPSLPLVLSGLSMHVKGGERLGIVGRTGAGKSSIILSLFRLVELSAGSIKIDGLDISTLGLHDLRSRLAIIPQDPTLFKGTIRSNIDPFGERHDLELWSAIRQSGLISEAQLSDRSSDRIHLDSIVESEGLNFSLGQRQLMALTRALVKGSQIIVCDEATSSVDTETDNKIQHTMATAFKGKTLLCIAHRLKTVISYDRICVMDQGRIAELDAPYALFEKGGIFRSMCDKSGIRKEDFERH